MFKFFRFITKIINIVVGFIVSLFEMIGYMIAFVSQGIVYTYTVIMLLPPWVLPFITAVIAWSVMMFIIKRGD